MNERELHLNNIIKILGFLRTEVELRNSINLYDINIHAEYFYRELFNLTYDWKLENLNAQTTNAAYIDLIDVKNKKAIQVTSQNDSGKIQKTIEGFFKNPDNGDFELKVLLIAKQAKNYKTDFTFDGKYKFEAEKDVIDIESIIAEINDKDTNSIRNISDFLTNEVNLPKSNFSSLPSNIPSPKGFIGRVDELKELQIAKDSGKTAFVLYGAGGVGKTDLALEFIRRNKAGYQADIRVDMQGLSDKPLSPNAAKLEVIRAFEPKVPADLSDADINNLYISFLNRHQTILFFDNAKDSNQVSTLSKNSPAFVVITSRETFNVSGGCGKEIEQMSPADARQLLYSMADEPRFDGQADALAYLAGYLPMALLPLAALLVSDITLEAKDLVQRYADRKELLRLADPNRENLSVEASFDLSYDTLSDELKTFWRKLAVFPADFDLEAMQAVWEVESGIAIRAELINKHLLEFNTKTKRSKLHDLARDYTNEKLIELELLQTRRNHWFYFVKLLDSPELNKNILKFDIEQANIIQGFEFLKHDVEIDNGYTLYQAVYTASTLYFLSLRFSFKEHLRWLEIGLKSAQKIKSDLCESHILNGLGVIYKEHCDYENALSFYIQALVLLNRILDNQSALDRDLVLIKKTQVLANLGVLNIMIGEYEQAFSYHRSNIPIFLELNDTISLAKEYVNLGLAQTLLKRLSDAIKSFRSAFKIIKHSDQIHSIQIKGNLFESLGKFKLDRGKYTPAIQYFHKSLHIAESIGDLNLKGRQLANLGILYKNLGEKDKARGFLLNASLTFSSIGSPKNIDVLQNLADLENGSEL